MDEGVARYDSPERRIGDVEGREVSDMELQVGECLSSLRDLACGDVVAHSCEAQFGEVTNDVSRTAPNVGDNAISASGKLGEPSEPIQGTCVAIEISKE
jgi:hypothetical protein